MKRRHSSSCATCADTNWCRCRYPFHSAARAASMLFMRSAVSASPATAARTAASNPARHDLVQPEAEGLQRVTDRVLQIEEFALEVAPVRAQQAQAVAGLALDVRALVPAGAHEVRDAQCVSRIGLVALDPQRCAYVQCFQAHHRKGAPIA